MRRAALAIFVLAVGVVLARSAPVADATIRLRTPGPTRVYLTGAGGAPVTPPGVPAYHKRDEHHFIAPGQIDVAVPPGRYRLTAERGPEHRPVSVEVALRAGERRDVELAPERWIDMNARGWYSADLHNHRTLDDTPALLVAEDLNLAPTLIDWVWEDRQVGHAPVTDQPIRSLDPRHAYSVLDKEVERLMEGPGAVNLLGLRSSVPFHGYRLFPPNTAYTEAAHRQGGYVDAEKIVWRDVAALVALGQVDFAGIVYNHFNRHDVELETDAWGMIPKWRPEFHTPAGMPLWAMEVYYHFLNCGFRLPASAGSASGVKAAPLGFSRVYARLDEPFSYSARFRALKAGRSFATNGPLLFLTVDGHEPGATVKVKPGAPVRVRVEARSLRPLERVEVVYRGRVVHATGAPRSAADFAGEFEFVPETDGWLAARVFEPAGRTARFAHTSPVYLDRGTPASAVADARFFLDWIDREAAFYRASTAFRSEADRAAMLDVFARGRAVYERLAADGARALRAPIVLNDDGGWCWFQDERALVLAGGRLVFGSVAAGRSDPSRRGKVEATSVDLATGASTRFTLSATPVEKPRRYDDHDTPAFTVRGDGRLVAVWSGHGFDNHILSRVSLRPGDATAWSDERAFVPSPSSSVTYSNLYRLAGERGRIYDFFRGLDNRFKPSVAWSDDEGESWRKGGVVIDVPAVFRHRPYVKYASDGQDTIHLAYTEGHPRNFDNSLYHAFYRSGTLHRSDGTAIRLLAEGLRDPVEGTRIFAGDARNVAWVTDLELDAEGRPFVAYSVQKDSAGLPPREGGADHRYRLARWTGQAWDDREIAFAGSRLYAGEDDYTGLVALVPGDPTRVFISTDADPVTGAPLVSAADGKRHWEIFRGVTVDGGRTWRWQAVTRDSTADNLRPIVPRTERREELLLWLRGQYRSYTDYDLEVVGLLPAR